MRLSGAVLSLHSMRKAFHFDLWSLFINIFVSWIYTVLFLHYIHCFALRLLVAWCLNMVSVGSLYCNNGKRAEMFINFKLLNITAYCTWFKLVMIESFFSNSFECIFFSHEITEFLVRKARERKMFRGGKVY